jgi:hypothetical protein
MSAEIIRLIVDRDPPPAPPPGWTVVPVGARWVAQRQYVPGRVAGAVVRGGSAAEACEAARRFEGVRE